MNWYIVIIVSADYHILYDGYEIVKADTPQNAAKEAKINYINKYYGGKGDGGFGSYRSIENIINCGRKKPKEM